MSARFVIRGLTFLFCMLLASWFFVSSIPANADVSINGGSAGVASFTGTKNPSSETSALQGNWNWNELRDTTAAWARGPLAIDSSGNVTGTVVDWMGAAYEVSTVLTVNNDLVSNPNIPTFQGALDSGGTVMAGAQNSTPGAVDWSGNSNDVQMTLFVRQGASYSIGDMNGNWEYYSFHSPGPFWVRGEININNGSWTANYSRWDGTITSGSGTAGIASSGIITGLPNTQNSQCAMDAGKTFMACTYAYNSGTDIAMLVKEPTTSVSLPDVAGTWQMNEITSTSGQPLWVRGRISWDSSGNIAGGQLAESNGAIITPTASASIGGSDMVNLSVDYNQCSMDADKTIMVCTAGNSTTGDSRISIFLKQQSSEMPAPQTLFSDDFESYTTGSFPGSGGWQLIYNGAGDSSQYVDNIHSVSGSQSLHLVGSSCWSADAYHSITDMPTQVSLEAHVFVDQIVSCGCSPQLATLELKNPDLNTWGAFFGRVGFYCDGNIYAIRDSYDSSKDVLLMPYDAGKWYDVKLNVDLDAKTFDVYIDGILQHSGLQIIGSGMPTGASLQAGHGDNPTVWFDDVTVSSDNQTPVNGSPRLDLGSRGGGRGATVQIPITLTNVAGTSIASTGVDIGYDTGVLGNPTASIGPAGSSAGKSVSASIPSPGVFRVGVLGLNTTAIGDGPVAYVTFTIDPGAAPGVTTTLTNTPSASDPAGNPVSVVGSNGAITVISEAGDCDGDGVVTIAEAQAAINMYLGINPVSSCVDTDSDGTVDIAEVQKVINNYLGL